MKRLALRLSAVGVILVAGVVAIAQTQFRPARTGAQANENPSTPDTLAGGTLGPIPDDDTTTVGPDDGGPAGASIGLQPPPTHFASNTSLSDDTYSDAPAAGAQYSLDDQPSPPPADPGSSYPGGDYGDGSPPYGDNGPASGQPTPEELPPPVDSGNPPKNALRNADIVTVGAEQIGDAYDAAGGQPSAGGQPVDSDAPTGGYEPPGTPPGNLTDAPRQPAAVDPPGYDPVVTGNGYDTGQPAYSNNSPAGAEALPAPVGNQDEPLPPPAGVVGQGDDGSQNYGSQNYGSENNGPNSYGSARPENPAQGDYGQGDYGQGDGRNYGAGPGEATAGDPGGAVPVPSGPTGQGTPGDPRLDGNQTPSLAVQKTAPPEIQVGRAATFEIRIRNVGQADAHQVIVTDEVPQGTRLVATKPEAAVARDGSLTWQLGTMQPGQETTLAVQVVPLAEGEIGSVAQVAFQAQASVRTTCTKPQLKVTHDAPQQVLIGSDVKLSITLQNDGTGAATSVVIEEDVPAGFTHPAGRELEYEVGTLQPQDARNLELSVRADKPGRIRNRIVARADGGILAEHVIEIEVIAPQLQVGIEGPQRRYLERQATYNLTVANPGTAPARDVELVAYMPKGMKFIKSDNQGRYDAQNHAVYWSLAELPATQQGSVQLTAVPVEMGAQKLTVQGRADMDLKHSDEKMIVVEGLAALFFQVGDSVDPVPVGGETVYEIRVTNTGSKEATNVQMVAQIPPGMQPINGEGPTRVIVEGQSAVAEPIGRLAPREEGVYQLRVRGVTEGDQRIRVQMTSNELESPVLKEESTRVYSDR